MQYVMMDVTEKIKLKNRAFLQFVQIEELMISKMLRGFIAFCYWENKIIISY